MLILNNSSNPLCSQECNTLINICLDNYQRYLYLKSESKKIFTNSLIRTNCRKSSSSETKHFFLALLVKSYQKLKNRFNRRRFSTKGKDQLHASKQISDLLIYLNSDNFYFTIKIIKSIKIALYNNNYNNTVIWS